MPQTPIFDAATVTPEQVASLHSIEGQSLTATNTESAIQAAQNMNPSPNIPAYKASPTSPVPLPQAPASPDYNAILAGLTTAQTNYDTTEKKIEGDTTALGNMSADEAALQEKYGVTANNAALKDLNAQLTTLNNEAAASKIRVEGQPIEMNSIDGQQKQIEHERTIKALGLSASIQAIQGNISLANDQVDRAIKLKYDPIKAEIDTLNKQLDYNYKNLTNAQKEKADALKVANDEKLKKITIQETADKEWATNKNNALANGAPLSVVQRAEALKSQGQEDAARSLLAPYTGTKSNDVNNNNNSSGLYTKTQLNNGSATAGIPLNDFKNLDSDTQNIFINPSKSGYTAKLKLIDQTKKDGGDPTQLEKEISESNAPDAVKDALIKKLWSVFPRPKAPKPRKKIFGIF